MGGASRGFGGRIRAWGWVLQLLLLGLWGLLPTAQAALSATNVTTPYAWGETSGWVNLAPSGGGALIYDDHLEGFAWAENIGWIKLGSHQGGGAYHYANTGNGDWGVNRQGAALSGYAWSETAGWINFAPQGGGVTVNGVSGALDGYAWGENLGWIHLRNGNLYGVTYAPAQGSTLSATAGTPQTASVTTAYGTALAVTLLNATGNPVVGASVVFTAPAAGASGSFVNGSNTVTVSTDAQGVARASAFTANATAGGPYTVTASQGGLTASFNLTNGALGSSIRLTSSANPVTTTTPLTLTAVVNGASPTGTVQFKDGSTALGAPVPLVGGRASTTTSTLSPGNHTLTAVYGGDANNSAATSSPLSQVVQAPTPTQPDTGSTLNVPALSLPASCYGAAPELLDLTQGDGPALLTRLINVLAQLQGSPLTWVVQGSCGAVITGNGASSGSSNAALAFAPTRRQSNDPRADGLYALGDGRYQIVTAGTAVTVVPTLVSSNQLYALLPAGSTVRMTDTGILLARIGGIDYVVQPSFLVTRVDAAPQGTASFSADPQGHLHMTDGAGNDQIIYPGFAEPGTLSTLFKIYDPSATVAIQPDGTARVFFLGQTLSLTPDIFLSPLPGHVPGNWWQDGPQHLQFINQQQGGTTQGLSVGP